jgi:NTP pyrophosphatase (non-canonical NTP hydrolase)
MKNKKNKLTPEQQALVVTMEECGELTQSCAKILRHGATAKKLRDLTEEAGDVMCLILILVKLGYLDIQDLEDRIQAKRDKLKIYSDIHFDS